MADFFSLSGQGYFLRITVSPGAASTEVAGLHGDRLKVRLAAAPEKGAANQALLAFLAKTLKLPRAAVRLAGGGQSRAKAVELLDQSPDLAQRLRQLIAPDV